tara:strand:+ start:27 stop:1091 length:1065 start_codon:yes stop_codon:yes gene_type:complete
MIAPYNYRVSAPGMVTLPTDNLRRYGRSRNGILGHNFFQNPIVSERTYNPNMNKPLNSGQPRTTVSTTQSGLPMMDMGDLVGGTVKALGPTIGAKLALEGAKQGASGLSVIPAGMQGYYDSAGNYISNIGTNLSNTGQNLLGNLSDMTTKVGDYFSPEAASDGLQYSLSNFGSPTPPNLMGPLSMSPALPQTVSTGYIDPIVGQNALAESGLDYMARMSANPNLGLESTSQTLGSMADQAAQAGNYFYQPGFNFNANMQSGGYGAGVFAGGASLVGDVIAGGTGALKEADTWANSITSGVGAGIGFALGGPIGSAVGSFAAKTVAGKWVGNAIDAVGDKIGEVGEKIADFFGFG